MLPALLGAASLIGKLFGGGGAASAQARAHEADLNVLRDRTALDRYSAEQNANVQNANLDMTQRDFALKAPGQRAGNSMRGDILATLQKPTGGGQFDFTSMAPSISDATRGVGKLMARDALLGQLKGDHFDPIRSIPVPRETAIPKAGFMEKLGGAAGLIGGLAGGVGDLLAMRNGGSGGASNVTQGASTPQAVNVVGAIPGGAVMPRKVDPRLVSRPISLG